MGGISLSDVLDSLANIDSSLGATKGQVAQNYAAMIGQGEQQIAATKNSD